ncbi:MAG: 3-hydroxyisobutyrate dehydrogenase [Pseudomonadota bacterium]
MSKIAFIGLGNMGGPMATNLVKAGHTVTGFDFSKEALDAASNHGILPSTSAKECVDGAEVILTMLPAGKHVLAVYEEICSLASADSLLIDSSTIDIASAEKAHAMAEAAGLRSVDAPVSGGVMGAVNGTLAFMVGGKDRALDAAEPVLEPMAGRIVRCGGPTAGQAAKVCNNMILAVTMIGTAEAFEMGRRLGLEDQALFDVVSTASGQSWSTTTYCPVPGPVPTSPANNDYKPGFAAALMLKDLGLSQEAASKTEAYTPLGAQALALYDQFCADGHGDVDFSGIIKMMENAKK